MYIFLHLTIILCSCIPGEGGGGEGDCTLMSCMKALCVCVRGGGGGGIYIIINTDFLFFSPVYISVFNYCV